MDATYDASAMSSSPINLSSYYRKQASALRLERTSWMQHWRDLAEHISPRRHRLLYTSTAAVNKGWKKNQSIINGKATWAARVQSAGMMAGITSPARPWFTLEVDDPDLNEFKPVRSYLESVSDIVRRAMLRCNFYKMLPLTYWDLSVFGTSCGMLEDDEYTKLRSYSFPIGQYYLANDDRGLPTTMYREVKFTTKQLVDKFGDGDPDSAKAKKFISPGVLAQCRAKNYQMWIDVLHVIEPNTDVEYGATGAAGMQYRSAWLENSSNQNYDERFLRQGGYEECPFIATRWQLAGEDVYGASPGMEVLGDVRALQMYEKRKAQLVDKLTSPPMTGPSALQNQRISLLPGDMTYVDANNPASAFRPAIEINPQAVNVCEESIREHEKRIAEGFYADLWLMLAQNETTMTATEVAERHEEKMLQLGPVLEQVEDELLTPSVERFIAVLARQGLLPPPPQELQGRDVTPRYTSVMAQAQKLVSTSGITKLAGFVLNLAAGKPEVLDKIDTDVMIEKMADSLGVAPEMIRDAGQVKSIRDQRAQAQAAAQQHQMQMDQAKAAQQLGSTDMSGDNALKRVLGPSNVATAQGTAQGPVPTLQ